MCSPNEKIVFLKENNKFLRNTCSQGPYWWFCRNTYKNFFLLLYFLFFKLSYWLHHFLTFVPQTRHYNIEHRTFSYFKGGFHTGLLDMSEFSHRVWFTLLVVKLTWSLMCRRRNQPFEIILGSEPWCNSGTVWLQTNCSMCKKKKELNQQESMKKVKQILNHKIWMSLKHWNNWIM